MSDAARTLNVFFDVDHTLVYTTHEQSSLRPGAHEAMARLKDAGHSTRSSGSASRSGSTGVSTSTRGWSQRRT